MCGIGNRVVSETIYYNTYQTILLKCKIYSNKKGSTREPFVEIWDKKKKEWVKKNQSLL